jgi:hypothetical protein
MKKLLLVVLSLFIIAATPSSERDGTLLNMGPSLPVGGRDSATNLSGMFEFDSSTGVNAQWVTTSGSSTMQVCDALGNCAEVEQFNATHAINLYSLLVSSGLYAYSGVSGAMNRLLQYASGDAQGATPTGLGTVNFNHFYDGANFRRWLGGTADNDAIASATATPYDQCMLLGYDSAGGVWQRASLLATYADNLALTLNGLMTASVIYGYDGAQLDMARVDALGGLITGRDWAVAGEDAGSDWTKIKKEQVGVVTPAVEGPTAVDNTIDVVCTSREILSDVNWCMWFKNMGGGAGSALIDAIVEVSPDGLSWVSLTWTTCDALATPNTCVYCVTGNAYRYMRGSAQTGPANSTTIDCWYTANKG